MLTLWERFSWFGKFHQGKMVSFLIVGHSDRGGRNREETHGGSVDAHPGP
jgi:hypothetical protein